MNTLSTITKPSDLAPKTLSKMFGIEKYFPLIEAICAYPEQQQRILVVGCHGSGKSLFSELLFKRLACQNPIEIDSCNDCECCRNTDDYMDYWADAALTDSRRAFLSKLDELPSGTMLTLCRKVFLYDNIDLLSSSQLNYVSSVMERKCNNGHMIVTATEMKRLPEPLINRFTPIHLEYTKQSMRAVGNDIAQKLAIEFDAAALYVVIDNGQYLPGALLKFLRDFKLTSRPLTLTNLNHPVLEASGSAIELTDEMAAVALKERVKPKLLKGH